MKTKKTVKNANLYVLFEFLSIPKALLISFSILMLNNKISSKKKNIYNELKQVLYCHYELKMSDKFKYGDVKNCCFFNDIINIKNWDPDNIKIDLVYKNIFFFTTLVM